MVHLKGPQASREFNSVVNQLIIDTCTLVVLNMIIYTVIHR